MIESENSQVFNLGQRVNLAHRQCRYMLHVLKDLHTVKKRRRGAAQQGGLTSRDGRVIHSRLLQEASRYRVRQK